jgi:hypothetical protein
MSLGLDSNLATLDVIGTSTTEVLVKEEPMKEEQHPSLFLRILPPEVRLIIYEYCLDNR